MTESFYIKVTIKSNEELEYSDPNNEDSIRPSPTRQKNKFNREVEKAVKKALIENVDYLGSILDEDEGTTITISQALEDVASNYYDADSDLQAITENMTQDIKFTVVKKIK